ncbi:MAG: hypothetical protein WCA82_03410 [Jiangellales bacterium]
MPTVIAADSLVTGGPVHAPGAVSIDGSTITAVSGTVPERVDVRVAHLVPGFVDIHTHGAGGATVVGADQQAIATFAATHRRFGTTTICASLVSAHPQPPPDDVAGCRPGIPSSTARSSSASSPATSTSPTVPSTAGIWRSTCPCRRSPHVPGSRR